MDQLTLDLEAAKRDAALDLLEEHRGSLVVIARETAKTIAKQNGRVTSNEVFSALRDLGLGRALDSVDPRWMGAVFRAGWKRIGFENRGSHRRPISIWTINEESA